MASTLCWKIELQVVVEIYFKNSKSITAKNNVVKMAKDLVAAAKRGFTPSSKVVDFPAKEEAVESFALAA